MTKKEIFDTLNAMHVEKFNFARKCAERCFEAEMDDWDAFTAINSLAVECNTIITTAEALGVDILRAEIDKSMVRMWRLEAERGEGILQPFTTKKVRNG